MSHLDYPPVGAHGEEATPAQLAILRERIKTAPPRDPWKDLGNATDRRSAAAHLIRLGLHPIAIHGLRDGKCTCHLGSECGAAGKHPLTKGWQKANLDGAMLDQMLATNWSWNLGLRMGRQPNGWHLVAIDVDGPHELLAPLEAEHGKLPLTLTARTGSGGWHLVYRVAPDKSPGNRVRLAPGIDVRAEGGQIVTAPSRHRSGNPYRWVELREPAVLP